MDITQNDKEILRKLASRYMEISSLPVQQKKKELWKALNRGKMQRPMVVLDQLPWHELNNEGELTCLSQNSFCKGLEWDLRSTIYKWEHFPVDMVVEPFITIPKSIINTGYGIGVIEDLLRIDENNGVVSHHYNNQIKTEEDICKIKDMQIFHNEEGSRIFMEQAEDIFKGIAPIKQSGGLQFHLGVWDMLSMLMGVENIYFDLIDRPEFIHAVMERITSSVIAGIEQTNKLGIYNDISNTCHCSYVYTDELLPDFGAGKGPVSQNSWAFGLAQLFTSVSPAFTEEFELPYISRMAEYFGMIYYGCCDRLDDRLDVVKKIPNVKKVSCSPWSDRNVFAENIGPDLVMSNKPTPALVAMDTFEGDEIKKDLELTMLAAKRNNVNLEFILKDISTVKYQPKRLTEWADIAMKTVSK
ncbi:MAG: hypothetical protein WCN92_11110 [Eubacteriales bacterium]